MPKAVVVFCCVVSRPLMFAFTSPRVEYVHGTVTPSQFAGLGLPPVKWSFSSAVTTNSVLDLSIPSLASRVKNWPNAVS